MRQTIAMLGACALALGVGACGSSSSSSTGTSNGSSQGSAYGGGAATKPAGATPVTGTVTLAADPTGQLKFDKSRVTAKAGQVTLVFRNPSPTQHGLSVQGNGIDKDGKPIGQGATATLSVALRPGTYTFYCPVPGHRQAGMQGTLVVQ